MKKGLAVLLCLSIAFLPAIANAGAGGAGVKPLGFYKSLLPPLPKPKLPNATATEPKLDLTVAPKKRQAETSSAHSVSDSSTTPCSAEDCPQAMSNPPSGYQNQNISKITYETNSNGGGTVDVLQSAAQAIQNWSSFNVGAKWTVNFEQKSSSWVILNRIWDQNPSQIFGTISALGKVYLINQNGILFGQGSQVNVYTMIASSLNISDPDFMNGQFNFSAQDYQETGNTNYLNASVINQGTITTGNLGSVFLLAPNVTNAGTISTTAGQIGLAAGTNISLFADTTPGTTRTALIVDVVNTTGTAINTENGQMTAETGLIGMYGQDVTQDGVISAVTELRRNGQIELLASNSVTTGPGSITSTPISYSTEAADSRFQFQPGTITIGGPYSGALLETIVNDGALVSPSGTITLSAQQRVFLENGSSIDVSGLWIDEPASADVIKVQMNSYNLRDAPTQKTGIIKGQYITVDLLTGSSIGDISQAILAQEKTAQQFSQTGGSIAINSSGDIIAKEGAVLNFAGGGTNYASGNVTTSGLISGNKTYAISNAPETLQYTGITSITNYVSGFVQGANAGKLSLNGRYVVLDGQLNGSVTRGTYQTLASELTDSVADVKTDGLVEPTGGTLIIGNAGGLIAANALVADYGLDSIILEKSVTPLPSNFGPNDQPYTGPETTVLSTSSLNAAGLSNLQIYTNTTLTIDAGAQVTLNPGGSFTAIARQIVDQGAISIPGGTISLTLKDNFTSFVGSGYIPMDSFIHLDAGSSLDVSGQTINGSTQAGWNDVLHIGGGKISVMDETISGQGIVMQEGASIDVSGGYSISPSGTVTGGNAGTLTMQGYGIILDGSLSGMSLVGNKGGSISLTAENVWVTSSPQSLPQDYNAEAPNYLILGSSQLDSTGFTQITLKAADKLTFDSGTLSPSFTKYYFPAGETASGEVVPISVSPDLITSSSIAAQAGVEFTGIPDFAVTTVPNAPLTISSTAAIQVAPGGTVALGAPQVTVSGVVSAPAGNITVIANQDNLVLNGAQILAPGYNMPNLKSVAPSVPDSYTAMGGGNVILEATNTNGSATSGNVIVDAGSVVDVSGSAPVTTYILNSGVPTPVTVAGAPGSVTISFTGNNSSLLGNLKGQAFLSGLQGGTLSISSMNTSSGYTLTSADIGKYLGAGFDDLTFQSQVALEFSGFSAATTYQIGRGLTLDAPVITGSAGEQINISAPWIQLQNTFSTPQSTAAGGLAELSLSGGWIDITGSILFSGFQQLNLTAQNDIRLSYYSYGLLTQGQLETLGDVTLKAAQVYPVTQANFTISSGGTVTVLGNDTSGSGLVYSAGGSLTIDAQNIDIEKGYLAAPMGQIDLNATDRVYFSSGSVVTTAGTVPIVYGSLNNVSWTTQDLLTNTTVQVNGAPAASVKITGAEIIAMPGSKIDVSGGGGIFSYQFQSSLQGTVDPLIANGSFVIIPKGNCSLPGAAVYLEGGNGVPAGVYSILSEQYAWLPGAMVVTPLGGTIAAGQHLSTSDGYPIMAGYSTFMGTNVQSPPMSEYEIRPAAVVFQQGYFNTSSFSAGDAGSVTLTGNTTVVEGTILANALKGYQGGSISLSGANAFIENSTSQLLPTDFNFDTPVDPSFSGTLHVLASSLSGFNEINIGNLNPFNGVVTQSIEMEQGSVLQASQVVLSAQNSITLDSEAQIITVDSTGNGSTSLITPTGLLTMGPNSLVHASDTVTMTIGQLSFQGSLKIDNGTLNLTGQDVYFVPQGSSLPTQQDPYGLYLTSAFWSNFASIKNVNLTASGVAQSNSPGLVQFLGDMTLAPQNSATQSFTINAASIQETGSSGGGVVIYAPSISLLNTTGMTPGSPVLQNTGSLTLNASEISVGEGALLLDGFASVNFNASKAIAFLGAGSLTTGAGSLNFASGFITTSYYTDANTAYTAANFTIRAPNAVVDISPPTGGTAAPGNTVTPGGSLEIDANSINVTGVMQMASGTLTLSGASGVTLSGTAQILDGGSIQAITVNGQTTYSCSPGGSVYLNAASGPVFIGSNAVVDVSGVKSDASTDPNDPGVNAGLISIYSSGTATLLGTLKGQAGTRTVDGSSGTGGSFILDADNIVNKQDGTFDFSALLATLTQAPVSAGVTPTGFTQDIDIRVRGQSNPVNLVIKATDAIYANNVNLTADNGSIDFYGTIDSSFLGGGGTIQFNSGGNLTLEAASKIISPGATVFLNSADSASGQTGYLSFAGSIDVTGGSGQLGGVVHFLGSLSDLSPSQNLSNVQANMSLTGTITGANQVLAEGVLFGGNTGVSAQQVTYTANNGYIYDANIGNWYNGIQSFMNGQGQTIQSTLFTGLTLKNCNSAAEFVPGLEVRSSGDLTLASAWDFTNGGSSYGSWDNIGTGPGFVTLRAGGNLNISNNLTDAPSGVITTQTPQSSWGLNLIAGADLNSSNLMATVKGLGVGSGNLTIADGMMVYTEDAPIRFASGNDTLIGSGAPIGYMTNNVIRYNLGSFSGTVQGQVGGDLIIKAGAIQTATGDIDIIVGGNLLLESGSIFGSSTGQITTLGSIRTLGLTPIETIRGRAFQAYWNSSGGGNIDLTVVGAVEGNVQSNAWDYIYSSRQLGTNWGALYVDSSGSGYYTTAGLVTMGGGNLTVHAGGEFLCQAGTFGIGSGNLTIYSGGNIDGLFLIRNGTAELTAMGNFGSLSTVIEAFSANINLTAQGTVELATVANPTVAEGLSIIGYSESSSVTLTAVTGDVTLSGADPFALAGEASLACILPPDFEVYAGRNISIESDFALAPAPYGNLILVAGANIDGEYTANGSQSNSNIYVSDLNPSQVYGVKLAPTILFSQTAHSTTLLHAGDPNPIVINAGSNIENIQLYLPKKADITAGGNISNIFLLGQNLSTGDVTTVEAGGNILFNSTSANTTVFDSGIKIAGPGLLVVESGGSIDLGTSDGIQSIGDIFNPALQNVSSSGSTILVASGYSKDFTLDKTSTFFGELGAAGNTYSNEMAAGDTSDAKKTAQDAETGIIDPFLGSSTQNSASYIDMTNSQISTAAGGAVYVLCSGTLNVGKSSFGTNSAQSSTGIYTSAGGDINIYAEGDVNVNQSRVMTFDGGSITTWSNHGNINAGKGSPTAVNLLPPQQVNVNGVIVSEFVPPEIGSGIRATSYDPDTQIGNVYLFAPQGVIDASEAGIAGNKVILGALQVLNAQNIVSLSGSVGVPTGSQSTAGLTALSGVGSVTQAMQTQESAISSAAGNKLAQNISATSDAFTASLEVKVLSVFDVDSSESSWEKTDN